MGFKFCVDFKMSSIPNSFYKYGLLAGLGIGALVEYENLDIFYNTFGRDIKTIAIYSRILFEYRKLQRLNKTVPDYFYETVKRHGDKPMIIYAETDEIWTFNDVNRLSNKLAHYFLSIGYQRGDSIALFMENHPKYMVVLLAMAKIGVTVALINCNLIDEGLVHSINIAKCRGIVYQHKLEPVLAKVAANLVAPPEKELFQFFSINNESGIPNLIGNAVKVDEAFEGFPETALPRNIRKSVKWNDQFCYIYTSGTTGLPKAAVGDHGRYTLGSMISIILAGVRDTDTIYTGLPLYHSSAQWFALGSSIHGGCTVVLRKNFSASKFWPDAVKYKATVGQYIGEIARFLLARPKCPEETQHCIRMFYGVGMRPKIWQEFIDRFKIPQVLEMYGSTEGTVGLINTVNKVGAVGYLPQIFSSILPRFLPITVIKLDENGEPLRDSKTGLCIQCKPNEEGEIIGLVRPDDRGGPEKFQAYVNNKEGSAKKMIRSVFTKGDVGFRSGDILVMDKYGFLYFRDRTGDTFRWRGENVSTTEVESVIANLCGHKEAVCYGVEVPGAEGKAGMVAILDPENTVDLVKLAAEIHRKLPKYARPLFIRLIQELKLTGTYKLMKKDLQTEAYDVSKINDPIYFMGPQDKVYKKLDHDLFHQIQAEMPLHDGAKL